MAYWLQQELLFTAMYTLTSNGERKSTNLIYFSLTSEGLPHFDRRDSDDGCLSIVTEQEKQQTA
jgi:hypothetical protein